MKDNRVEFTVEGIGKIVAYKEPPATQALFSKRQELGKMVGGITELIKMESLIRAHRDSSNEAERDTALALMTELMRMNAYLNLRDCVLEPRDFNVDKLTPEEFERVWSAYDQARGIFPEETGGDAEPDSPVAGSTGQPGKAPV